MSHAHGGWPNDSSLMFEKFDPHVPICSAPTRRQKHAWTAIEKKEKEGGASGARGRGVGGRGRGRTRGTPPAEATMPLAALQAARGAPLAGLPHAPEGREGREAGLVTRGHGRCGPRRARARGSP